jgi:hypothetical protein
VRRDEHIPQTRGGPVAFGIAGQTRGGAATPDYGTYLFPAAL